MRNRRPPYPTIPLNSYRLAGRALRCVGAGASGENPRFPRAISTLCQRACLGSRAAARASMVDAARARGKGRSRPLSSLKPPGARHRYVRPGAGRSSAAPSPARAQGRVTSRADRQPALAEACLLAVPHP